MAEIQSLTIRHEAIMDYLMTNPTVRLGDVATHFGITQPWLSQVIHSDAFQAMLREKQTVAFHHTVLPLREKMVNVAHLALDRLADQLPMETETKTISQVADSVLDRLGFGSKQIAAGGVQVNVQVNNLRNEIAEARQLLGQVQQTPRLEVIVDGERAPIALPRENHPRVGEALEASAFSFVQAPDPA